MRTVYFPTVICALSLSLARLLARVVQHLTAVKIQQIGI
jgi:hypothetical protein